MLLMLKAWQLVCYRGNLRYGITFFANLSHAQYEGLLGGPGEFTKYAFESESLGTEGFTGNTY